MKRITLLAVVLALAVVPAALADNGTDPAPQQTAAGQTAAHPRVRAHVEILRLRLRIARLEFALHCRGDKRSGSQGCVDFANTVEQHLQTLDSKVQQRIQTLQACTSDSTDTSCRNAAEKIALLQKIDARVQALIAKVQAWLSGSSGSGSGGGSSGGGLRVQKLQALDAKVQQRIQALQGCASGSTDPQCRNSDRKLPRLRALDQKLQAAIAKLQGGSGASSGDGTSEGALDQAASGLNQLAQSVASNG